MAQLTFPCPEVGKQFLPAPRHNGITGGLQTCFFRLFPSVHFHPLHVADVLPLV